MNPDDIAFGKDGTLHITDAGSQDPYWEPRGRIIRIERTAAATVFAADIAADGHMTARGRGQKFIYGFTALAEGIRQSIGGSEAWPFQDPVMCPRCAARAVAPSCRTPRR